MTADQIGASAISKEWATLGTNSIAATSAIASFPAGKVSIMAITSGGQGSYPDYGNLVVDRRNPDPAFQYRYLYGYTGNQDVYFQRNAFSGWKSWKRLASTDLNGALSGD